MAWSVVFKAMHDQVKVLPTLFAARYHKLDTITVGLDALFA